LNLRENCSRAVSFDMKVTIKFRNSSGSGSGSMEFLKEFYHCGIP